MVAGIPQGPPDVRKVLVSMSFRRLGNILQQLERASELSGYPGFPRSARNGAGDSRNGGSAIRQARAPLQAEPAGRDRVEA